MTNGDRIRQMSNEELAITLGEKMACNICIFTEKTYCRTCDCREGIKAYLESEEE
jgi:hypothetical protein